VRVLQALFFLGGISASTWGRFGLVYYTQKGLSSTQIGQIEGALPLVKLVGQPFWGLVADYTRSKKIVSLVTMFISTAILMLLAFPAIASTFTIIMLITCALSAFSAPGVLDAYAMDTLGDKHKHK
jgi:MFS family permease